MKRFVILLSLLFCNVVFADTINLHWLNEDGSTYQNSTCTVNGDLEIPSTPPTRYGYTFTGWKISNYIPIEYIESTGTQWIDTGIKQSDYFQDLIINVVFKYVSSSGGAPMLFAAFNGNDYFNFYATSQNFYMQSGPGGTQSSITQFDTNKHTMIVNSIQKNVIMDGVVYSYSTNTGNVSSNIHLLNRNGEYFALARIYNISFRTANNILVRDFIPVLDKDGVPCMYDKVTEQFFYNQGTGQFIAGPAL